MAYITVGHENSTDIDLYYEDHGAGQPIVLVHGYPLSSASWEKQIPALLGAGYRVIAYDRRGAGKSSKPTVGYDYDTFAADLKVIIDTLELKDVVLMGFSMGTGELGRYIGNYGSDNIAKAVFLAPLEPFMIKTDDHPIGLDPSVYAGAHQAAQTDRFAHYAGFAADFLNVDVLLGTEFVSEQVVQNVIDDATQMSGFATTASILTWSTDFRDDVAKFDLPILIVQGTADRVLPIDFGGRQLHSVLPEADYVEIEGAPHAMGWTHAPQLNAAVVSFLAK